jgi:hypothetical protein
MRAPRRAPEATAIHDILDSRIRRSGLDIRFQGTHALRHAFAVRLLRQGIPMKTIGDTLGHRDAESTAVYLRLAIEDLRAVGLPVPETAQAAALLPAGWRNDMPRVRLHVDCSHIIPTPRFRVVGQFPYTSIWPPSKRWGAGMTRRQGCYGTGTLLLSSFIPIPQPRMGQCFTPGPRV